MLHRYGLDFRAAWHQFVLSGFAKFNDWGPYDYDRDFNLTFPVQLQADLGYTLGSVKWLNLAGGQTRVGIAGKLRYLNAYSNRFAPDPSNPTAWGEEYELRTYVIVSL